MNVYLQERKSIRRAIAVDCKVLRQRDLGVLSTSSVDLSLEGMLAPSQAEVDVEEPVLVSFRIPQLSRTFTAHGRVARVVRGERRGDRFGRCLGIEFEDFDALSKIFLSAHLRRVPPPLPARTKRIDYAATVRRIAGVLFG